MSVCALDCRVVCKHIFAQYILFSLSSDLEHGSFTGFGCVNKSLVKFLDFGNIESSGLFASGEDARS